MVGTCPKDACVLSHSVVSDSLRPYGASQAPLSMGFSGQEYWSGLPCLSPGDFPGPGMEPEVLRPPPLAGGKRHPKDDLEDNPTTVILVLF